MSRKEGHPQSGVAPRLAGVTPDLQKPRRNYARWRALCLSLVYVVFAVHIVHWRIKGKTLAPLELNEVMYTLELGIITAGFLFMCFLVLAAMIFGRFFCSWACHIMVLQDLCAWILRKCGIRQKAIRARALLLVPPLTAFYMFIWPQILRAWRSRAFPEFHLRSDAEGWASFATTNFWRNLPSAPIIVLTFLVCGFIIVYLLGSRTFCTYVCPYGAIFALADRFSPGRIRVNDKCQQCGTCTAACTSSVRVHEEVNRYGMIVNPSCLKDLDCVSACPQQALSYRFGRPSLFKSVRRGGRFGLPYDFSWPEEILMGVMFVVGACTFRGLYSRVPFLMSLALAGIIAYLAVVVVRLVRWPDLGLATMRLKKAGRFTASGAAFAVFALLLTAFVGHSVFLRYHEYTGLKQVLALDQATTAEDREALAVSAREHLLAADRWGLIENERTIHGLMKTAMRLRQPQEAERHALRLLERRPADTTTRLQLGQALVASGRLEESEQQFRTVITHGGSETREERATLASAHHALAGLIGRRGDFAGAAEELRVAVALDPRRAALRAELGSLLAELGQFDEAVTGLEEAVRLDPSLGDAEYNLGVILARLERFAEAVVHYQRAVELSPQNSALLNNLGFALLRLHRYEEAQHQLERALEVDANNADAHFNLGSLLAVQHRPEEAAEHFATAAHLDPRYARLLHDQRPE